MTSARICNSSGALREVVNLGVPAVIVPGCCSLYSRLGSLADGLIVMQHAKILEINFGIAGNAQTLPSHGWSSPEDGFTWSEGTCAQLRVPRVGRTGEVIIFVRLSPFLNPPQLQSQMLSVEVDGIIKFCGRCWGDMRLALRHTFVDLSEDFTTLTARFSEASRPSEFGSPDTRLLGFQWRSISIVPISSGTTSGSGIRHYPVTGQDAVIRRTLEEWAGREITPWVVHKPSKSDVKDMFAHLNSTAHWAAMYQFAHGQVSFCPKPANVILDPVVFDRAQLYLKFFRSVSKLLPASFEATVCVCVADFPLRVAEAPIFAFQKTIGMETILIPDIDFLINNFFISPDFRDDRSYFEKKTRAVFAGSTTGGDITIDVAKHAGIPRLRSAEYFTRSSLVDFMLPSVVQYTSFEAEEVLRAKSFCRRHRLTWQEQCEYRFQISMDGNGAACSRMALCLSSNSVLLKYKSFESLFYFYGLTPWVQYIPIADDRGVEKVVEEELAAPGRFKQVAAEGKSFATRFLSKSAIETYMATILVFYADCFQG